MEGAAVQKIAELEDKNKVIEVGGKTFARAGFTPVQYIPRPTALVGKTLTGLIDYIRCNREGIMQDACMIQVVDYGRVELISAFNGDDLKRSEYYHAVLDEKLPSFRFDEYLPVEEFIIKARALFQHTDDLDTIISIVSKVVAQDEIASKDDGLAQTVTVKRGVSGAMTTDVETKGMYELRPYRTFREVQQPASKFILRLKGGDGLPRVALFDAEGGSWRYAAMQTVKSILIADLEITGIEIPVFA